MENKKTHEDAVLMMPVFDVQKEEPSFTPSSGMTETLLGTMPVKYNDILEFVKGFTDYKLDTIEVHVKGVAKTGGVTQLLVGLSGEAGLKLVLKKGENEE